MLLCVLHAHLCGYSRSAYPALQCSLPIVFTLLDIQGSNIVYYKVQKTVHIVHDHDIVAYTKHLVLASVYHCGTTLCSDTVCVQATLAISST